MDILVGFLELLKARPKLQRLAAKFGYKANEKQAIRLNKALYSLKQSPQEWQEALRALLRLEGYKPLISDLAIFYNP